MDEAEWLEIEIQSVFSVERISDGGVFVIHTPIKVGGDLLELYLFETGGKYRLTDDGYLLSAYLFDEQIEEEYHESAQKWGLDFVDGEVVKLIDDSKDIAKAIFEIVDWYYNEAIKIHDIF